MALATTHTESLPLGGNSQDATRDYKSFATTWTNTVAIETLVAAPAAGKKIVVHGVVHTSDYILGPGIMYSAANIVFAFYAVTAIDSNIMPFNKKGWFACGDAEALRFNPNAGIEESGSMVVIYSIQDVA